METINIIREIKRDLGQSSVKADNIPASLHAIASPVDKYFKLLEGK